MTSTTMPTSVTAQPSVPDTRPEPAPDAPRTPGLGAELRESLLLLGFAVGVTVGLTTAAQAALALLG